MTDESSKEFVRELFGGIGKVQVKHFFGGAGAYADGLMFALIADGAIYLKADAALQAELEGEGCGPFIWRPKSGRYAGQDVPLGYWRLPDAAMDDPDEAARWGRKALAVARAKAVKPKRKPAPRKGKT
jgi:DNA transformation protein